MNKHQGIPRIRSPGWRKDVWQAGKGMESWAVARGRFLEFARLRVLGHETTDLQRWLADQFWGQAVDWTAHTSRSGKMGSTNQSLNVQKDLPFQIWAVEYHWISEYWIIPTKPASHDCHKTANDSMTLNLRQLCWHNNLACPPLTSHSTQHLREHTPWNSHNF